MFRPALLLFLHCTNGAQNEIRTRDLVLTKNVLYQLSYLGFTGCRPLFSILERNVAA